MWWVCRLRGGGLCVCARGCGFWVVEVLVVTCCGCGFFAARLLFLVRWCVWLVGFVVPALLVWCGRLGVVGVSVAAGWLGSEEGRVGEEGRSRWAPDQ